MPEKKNSRSTDEALSFLAKTNVGRPMHPSNAENVIPGTVFAREDDNQDYDDSQDDIIKTKLFQRTQGGFHNKTEKQRRFAPLRTSLNRRLETLVILWHTITIPFLASLFFVLCTIPMLWPLIIVYLAFLYFDANTPSNGTSADRRVEWFRSLDIWKHFVNYYPISVYKTVDLEPTFKTKEIEVILPKYHQITTYLPNFINKYIPSHRVVIKKEIKTGPRYIFGYHPHGVVSLGITGAFATNACNISELLPGIRIYLLTLITQFKLPLLRDYLMALGISSVSKRNVIALIKRNQSVCIVIGGASESLLSKPHTIDIVLKKRKGFVKIALELGDTQLVPIFGFGENAAYNVFDPSVSAKSCSLLNYAQKKMCGFQLWLKQNFGFTFPFFHARGVFNHDFGLLPYRKPISLVIGRPIPIPYIHSPTQEQIEHYHSLYVEELKRVFEENKEKFNAGSMELRIVE
ncbi:BA75_00221T0 [Komagataella pastoris]|uniref:Diacylglycerol O-acyltransferase n=1 Tax=Komagataella pastoris TaxID=4922 RepID=A0A1B2J8E8_PICPA|nr:BA75_00221T0 [Komagataella pastoris]